MNETGQTPGLAEGTLVCTQRGLAPIGRLRPGDRVWTLAGRYRPILHMRETIADGILLKGQGTDGIICGSGQAVRTAIRSGPGVDDEAWTAAPDSAGRLWLNMGAAPPRLRRPSLPAGTIDTPAFWHMLGHWLGAGWLVRRSRQRDDGSTFVRLVIHTSRPSAPTLEARLNATGFTFSRMRERNTIRFSCQHRLLTEWVQRHLIRDDAKRVPAWMFGMPHASREALWEGFEHAAGVRSGVQTTARLSDRNLAMDMRMLAAGLGFSVSLLHHTPTSRERIVHGNIVRDRPWWTVTWRTGSRRTVPDASGYWAHLNHAVAQDGPIRLLQPVIMDDHSLLADGIPFGDATVRPDVEDPA